MEQQTLTIESREQNGKGPSRRLRRAGKLPGVVYGLGKVTSVTVNPFVVEKLLLTEGGRNTLLSVKGAGLDGRSVLVKDYQVDPVSRKLIHVDLLEIDVKKTVEVLVKLNIVGKSVGVAEGGVLNMVERQVPVRCLPTAIPAHIDVDVTALKVGDSIHYDEIKLPEGVERAISTNPTLVTVVPPTKEEEAAPSLAPTAEPEVITAKKEEGAEGAEGAPAKAGAAPAAGEKKEEKKEEKKK